MKFLGNVALALAAVGAVFTLACGDGGSHALTPTTISSPGSTPAVLSTVPGPADKGTPPPTATLPAPLANGAAVLLTIGSAEALSPGITLFLDEAAGEPDQRTLRVSSDAHGQTQKEHLFGFAEEYRPSDPEAQKNFGVVNWVADASGHEFYVALCTGVATCNCAVAPTPPGVAAVEVFRSTDAGEHWSAFVGLDNLHYLVGVDGDALIVGRQSGCSTQGPFYYWREPGHVPVPRPQVGGNDLGWNYAEVPGIGWTWISPPAGPTKLEDGTRAGPPLPWALSELPSAQFVFLPAGNYWQYVKGGTYLLQLGRVGEVTGVWKWPADYVRYLAVLTNGELLVTYHVDDVTAKSPERQHEWRPALVDLASATIHPIEGVTPADDEPAVELRMAVIAP